MIVTCGQCKTRFRLPDEKLAGDKSIRVRCAKCGSTFRVSREGTAPTPPPSDAQGGDPFARYGAAAEAAPPASASGRSMSTAGVAPSVAPVVAPTARGPAPFDFSSIGPSAPRPAGSSASAFDFSSLLPPTVAGAVPPTAAPQFDFSTLSAPSHAPEASRGSATPLDGGFEALGTVDAADVLDAPEPTVVAPVLPGLVRAAAEAHGSVAGDAPTLAPLFPQEAAVPNPTELMPRAPIAEALEHPLLDVPDLQTQGGAKGDWAPLPSASAPGAAGTDVKPVPAPSKAHVAAERRSAWMRMALTIAVAGMLLLFVAVAVSAGLNGGRLDRDAWSMQALAGLASAPPRFPISDVSNGLYETVDGRSIFFVRGLVTNRGAEGSRLSVRADIVEADAVLGSARSLAGAVPTPEELFEFNLSDPEGPKHFAERIAGRAQPVAPGATVGFLVAFSEYPPALESFQVRLSAEAEGLGAAGVPP